ncbi:Protein SABRE [Coemansia sp. RSA 2336]|nr:Protein SABRE [Coemansia sp. RSA 2336]
MHLPVVTFAAVVLLSALLPLPQQYTQSGSQLHGLLEMLRLPRFAVHILLHPLLISPLAHFLLLYFGLLAFSYPVRYFLRGFGLQVKEFTGNRLRGIVIKARMRQVEAVLRVDEIGFDVRTMRRLRMKIRTHWSRLRNWRRQTARTSQQSPDRPEPASSEPEGLSKRLQLFARGVRIQLIASASGADDGAADIDPLWFFDTPDQQQPPSAGHRESDGESMGRLAKRISTVLRTFTYVASLFAQWIDVCISDVSVMVVHSADMARAGHGITLHVARATIWAESLRDGAGESGNKYQSALAVEISGLRLIPGIETSQHMNSRWELVKMLVVQDMLAGASENSRPHGRGPALVCQNCTIRSDVTTTFWGLPKRMVQRIDIAQTHIRAGVLDALLDEVAIMRMAPGRSSSLSARGLRALNARISSVLNNHSTPESSENPGKALFLLHALLSQLRLEHVSIGLQLSELVVDLPLAVDALVVEPPAMLRWRQRGIELEGGYRWADNSSTDSTAFVRGEIGTVHVTALPEASMTPDTRAYELRDNIPGLRIRGCTLQGEMSAFLSEDLSHRPCPQPIVSINLVKPELAVDLGTQLAFDAAKKWALEITKRLQSMSLRKQPADSDSAGVSTSDQLLTLLDMIFAEVKIHITVENALYSVQPLVPLPTTSHTSCERINLRMQHLELHLHWAMANSRLAIVEFRMATSPITGQWENDPARVLLQVRRGIAADGCVDIRLGPQLRINANAEIDAGDVVAMLRERDFRLWLSMQPLWLVARLVGACKESEPLLEPLEERRQRLTATACVRFGQLRCTVMACDNAEDRQGNIEHGTQICFVGGSIDVRANGGSIEQPHPFGFRKDVGRLTFNVQCQRALMFLLSAVSADKARSQPPKPAPSGFVADDLCGYVPDTVQQHILLTYPKLKFSRCSIGPQRARMIIDLDTVGFSGLSGVSSVYRWSVIMHNLKYWRRRNKLAKRIAIQQNVAEQPDEIRVSINTDLLDLRSDLVSPVFFDLDRGLQLQERDAAKHVPQLRLRAPQVQFAFAKVDDGLKISLDAPVVTLYGDQQPLISLSECVARLQFPRKSKRAEMGAQQGVRCNSTFSKIDIAFARGGIALAHRYNMAETIDGFMLMQKACKRIARKSSHTCYPPVSEAMLAHGRLTKRQVMQVLGAQTFVPPPLRDLSNVKPPPPPRLKEPDDIPTINFHGGEFQIMVHDDPFETALAQIYQTGLAQQRERLSRLEAFEAKAQELRSAQSKKESVQNQKSASKHQRLSAHMEANDKRRHHRYRRRAAKTRSKEQSRISSNEQLRTVSAAQISRSLGRSNTYSPRNALASTSMQDVSTVGSVSTSSPQPPPLSKRNRTNSMAAATTSRAASPLAFENDEDECYSDCHSQSDNDAESPLNAAETVEAKIEAAYQRLMQVESKEWIRAIRQKMVDSSDSSGNSEQACAGFDEIFASLTPHSDTRPPYMYHAGSWTYPPVPLGRLVMSPVWVSFDTPLALLEFKQVEKYLRYLDPATPNKLEWSTLIPMRLRIKCGDIRMQLRDFPFPLFRVPDPYRQETGIDFERVSSFEELRGGMEVSGSLVLAERVAHERSLRSVYIPIGPRARDTPIDIPNVGWYMAKSLQFPRVFAALSTVLYSASEQQSAKLSQLPIMSAWGACYQPVISALMQRLESATSKSADVSPSLPWWDKLRSRLHFKSRMAVVDAFGLESERGQLFFLALDGRDPYQVTQKSSNYLFTMRGGVRMCLNEGMPGSELWDEASGHGIYSVPTEEDAPPSATLSEFMRLRCHEFFMGVPIIIDRQTQLQQIIESQQEASPEFVELLRRLSSDNSARYTFVSQDIDRLYYKVLLHLLGGVRMGIGLSSFIPPDNIGLRHNHWEVHPIAPEAAQTMKRIGVVDAYSGYRSTRLHTSVSLLCPFVDQHGKQQPFASIYLDKSGDIPHLRGPDTRIVDKPYTRWNAFEVEALISPLHSLFASDGSQDLFFLPFVSQQDPKAQSESWSSESLLPELEQRKASSTQCRISATEAVVECVQRYLPLYVSRMMLPVRKGSLYPFTETSDNKIGKCLRSVRLVLDLRNVELAYSQRDYEIKELETREVDILGLSPTPSDSNGQQSTSGGAKAEGILRELKARVNSFSFNLLLEQTQVKIRVGNSARGPGEMSPDSVSAKGKKRQQSNRHSAAATAREANALRWGVGDASLEIDYLDVRLTQLSFTLPLFTGVSTSGLSQTSQTINGLLFSGDLEEDMDMSWISCSSIRDLKELDISEAIFSDPSIVCVLWSPRLVYFTQRPELTPLDTPQLNQILDLPISPHDTQRSPLQADFAARENHMLQRSLSAQRARAVSDLRDVARLARPHTGNSTNSEDVDNEAASHRRNTSMPWSAAAMPGLAAESVPDVHAFDNSAQAPDSSGKTPPVTAMSYKSSFHLLGLARTRQRRLTASNSQHSIAPRPHRVDSDHDLVELQRQSSFPIEHTLSHHSSQMARMMPTGPDPKVIMRDSRSTQAMLLQKRKQMLGAAIAHEQAALAALSRAFEQASSKFNQQFRKDMVRRAEHIYELGARRKLINRCLRVLGVSPEADNGNDPGTAQIPEPELDFDRDTQEVEKVLASLYRHRCLIYSGYLIWTTQVRDKLMRFLYIQDCLTAIEYYMSESAANVVRKATSPKSNGTNASDDSTYRSRSYSESTAAKSATSASVTGNSQSQAGASTADDKIQQPQQKPSEASPSQPRRRSASQRSEASTSSRRSLRIPRLLRKLRSHEKLSSTSNSKSQGTGKDSSKKDPKKHRQKRRTTTGTNSGSKSGSKFEKGLSRVWDDFSRYLPYYSILVEFLNSQVSLRVDESSKESAIAVAERVQLHRILLCNEDDSSNETLNGPPSDEAVVKARSLVELENVQVFTAIRSDFESQAAYFVDCTYGSQLDADPSKPNTLWPAWIPIELLLSEGKHQVRGIFDELDDDNGNESDSGSEHTGESSAGKYGKAWWIQDLSKYKRLMNRNNGLVVYDKANPLRIQSDPADISQPPAVFMPDDKASMSGDAAAAATSPLGDNASYVNDPLSEVEADDTNDKDSDPIDDAETAGSEQGLSHRANHVSVFLPELNLACTAEQYLSVYEIVTELLVFIDPEKAAYMDHLNTIQLGMDMSDLRGLLSIIRATQTALRERMPLIYDWYSVQRSRAVLYGGSLGAHSNRSSISKQRAQASSLLTLDRHRRALELQLRTAMDLFGAAQKQMRRDAANKGKLAAAAAAARAMDVDVDKRQQQDTLLLSEASSRTSSLHAEETHNTIARTIHLFINKATWHMLENDERPLCDVTLRWASLKAVTTSDQATHLLSEVHLLYIVNRLPNPMFTDLVGPYIRPKHPKPDFCVEKMIRVQWSELAPVGGISIVERFEVDLFPLRLQLSHDIAQKLMNYLYPPQETMAGDEQVQKDMLSPRRHRRPTMNSIASEDSISAPQPAAVADGESSRVDLDMQGGVRATLEQKKRKPIDEQLRGSRAASNAPSLDERAAQPLPRVASGLLATISGRSTPLSLMENNSMINISQSGDNRDQVDEMKKRASSNKTFLHIKIGGSTLCISYQGRRANNITDLRDFEFHAPTLELRNQVESYFELLMQVKKEYMSVAVQHTGALVKEKFKQLHNRKAWNKASFGPDWEARRLLIDMDRTIDQEMAASMHGSLAMAAASTPMAGKEHFSKPAGSRQEGGANDGDIDSRESSVVSDAMAKGKAPLSKYMILDPRKLMGKRLPNVLPRNLALHDVGHSEPPPSPRLRALHFMQQQPPSLPLDDHHRAASCDPVDLGASANSSPLRAAPLLNRRFTTASTVATPSARSPPITPRISISSASANLGSQQKPM